MSSAGATVSTVTSTRIALQAAAQGADLVRPGRREQQRLARLRRPFDDGADRLEEAHVEHPVGLVEDEHPQPGEVDGPALQVIQDAARRADDDVGSHLQRRRLRADRHAAAQGHDPEVRNEARQAPHLGAHLVRQLAGRAEHQRLHPVALHVDAGQQAEPEGHGLAAAGAGLGDHVPAGEQPGQGVLLHGRHALEAQHLDGAGERRRELERGERRDCGLVHAPQYRPRVGAPSGATAVREKRVRESRAEGGRA